MKICIVTHTFPRFVDDFTAPFMDGVATGMAQAGNEVYVLMPFTSGFRREGDPYKIFTYRYLPFDSWHKIGYSQTLTNDMRVPLIMYIISPFMYFFGVLSLLRLVMKEKIDIINAHWILPNGFIGAVVSKITKVRLISTLPGSDVYMVRKNLLFSWMGQFAANQSAAITSNSPQLLADLKKIGIVNDNLQTIIYGVNPEKFKSIPKHAQQLRVQYQIPSDRTVVLGVGRFVEKKGFKYLIKAAASILESNPRTVFFIIGEGDQRPELEQLINKLGLSQYFIMPSWVNYKDLVKYYNFADVFILPSVRDAEGNLDDQSVAVVEAMACEKPIVTTDFPGYRIVVEDGENGYLVKEKDVSGIAQAVNRLVSSKPLRTKMGKKSRKLVLKSFSWHDIGKQYTDLFNQIVSKQWPN